MPLYEASLDTRRFDVAVVGAGITGSAATHFLAKTGADVVLLDRREVGTEASGRNAGSLHGQIQYEAFKQLGRAWAREFLPALSFVLASLRIWANLSSELGTELEVTTRGGLLLIDDQSDLSPVEEKLAIEQEIGLESKLLDADEVASLAPWVAPSVIAAEFSPVEGKANPMLAAPAFVRNAIAAGATVSARTEVLGIEAAANGVTLATSRGKVHADQVVLASGDQLARHTANFGVRLPITSEPIQVAATEPVAPLIGHLVYYAGGRLTLKQARAGTILIGGGWPARLDPASGYPRVNLASLRANLAVALRVAPAVADALLIRSWAGIGNGTPDHRPVLGSLRNLDRIHVGLFPHLGFTAGPLVGQVLADLAAGLDPSVDIAPFAPERFGA